MSMGYYDNSSNNYLSNDSSSKRQFIELTVYRTESLSNRQFIEPTVHRTTVHRTTVHRNDLSDLTVARHYYGVVITL